MHILLIHNDEAGSAAEQPDVIAVHLEGRGHTVDARSLADDWSSALHDDVELVAVTGGDGTVSAVARGLAPRKIPLAVVPTGTANNVAGALDLLDLSIEQQIARWEGGSRRRCDSGYALNSRTDGRFLESVGVGLLAEVMAKVAHGPAAFVDQMEDPRCRLAAARAVAVATLATQPAVEAELLIDGIEVSGRFLFVEVMNFGSAGPGIQLVPDADWSDGAFDVVWAEEHHRDALLSDLMRADGRAVVKTPLPRKRARQVGIQTDRRVHVDDRLVDSAFRLMLTVEPAALTFA